MATIKNKTKKKTAQDWEKELKELLKGETANTLKSAHISKLRAIRSAYYHIPASSRKNLSNRITTLSKQAEAIRKGTERAASNQVKKTKYKEAPQTKQRKEAKQTTDLRTKLGLPSIPEPGTVKAPEPKQSTTPTASSTTQNQPAQGILGGIKLPGFKSDEIPNLKPIDLEAYDIPKQQSPEELQKFIDNLNLRQKALSEKMEILREEAKYRGYEIQTLNLSDPQQIANQIVLFIDGQIHLRKEKQWTKWSNNYYNSGKSTETRNNLLDLLDKYMIAKNKGDEELADKIYSYIYNIYEYIITLTMYDYMAASDDLFEVADDVESLLNGAVSELHNTGLKEVYEPEEILSAKSLDLFNE